LRANSDTCSYPKFGCDIKELKLQEMRNKLIDFKYEVLKARCSSAPILPATDGIVRKPGWTRNLGDLIRKGKTEVSLQEADHARRYRELKTQVEEFVK